MLPLGYGDLPGPLLFLVLRRSLGLTFVSAPAVLKGGREGCGWIDRSPCESDGVQQGYFSRP